MDRNRLVAFIAFLVFAFMSAVLAINSLSENEQMTSCVNSGKNWVDNPDVLGVQMECRDE